MFPIFQINGVLVLAWRKSFYINDSCSIAHWRSIKRFYFIWLIIFDKFCLQLFLLLRIFYCMHQYSNRKLTTNRITCLFDIFIKCFSIILFNKIHSLMIELRNILMNLFTLFIWLICKMWPPMTKIWRYNENCVLVIKILCKSFTILLCKFIIYHTNNYWYYFNFILIFKKSPNHRHMHL